MKIHPAAELFPAMSEVEFQALKADIAAHGQVDDIVLLIPGDVLLDGRHRLRACNELGIQPSFVRLIGAEVGDPVTYVVSRNLHRRQLDASQRAMVAAKLKPLFEGQARERMLAGKAPTPPANLPEGSGDPFAALPDNDYQDPPPTAKGESREQAAAVVNVSPRSVEAASQVLAKGAPELVAAVEQGAVAVSAAAEVARALPVEQQRELVAEGPPAVAAAAKELREEKGKGLSTSKSNEWYTPQRIILAAHAILGAIDLDPASSAEANAVVQAEGYFTDAEDGLMQAWGTKASPLRVWLNPPYCKAEDGSSNFERWTKKLLDEYEAGNVEEALLLVNSNTDTAWFQELLPRWPVCFIRGRLKFWSPTEDDQAGPRVGSALFYIGKDSRTFERVARELGEIVLPRHVLEERWQRESYLSWRDEAKKSAYQVGEVVEVLRGKTWKPAQVDQVMRSPSGIERIYVTMADGTRVKGPLQHAMVRRVGVTA